MSGTSFSSTHPLIPPTSEDDRVSWLRLLRSRRVGISTFYRLMKEFGDANAALAALPDVAAQAGVQDYHPCPVEVAQKELKAGHKSGAQLVFIGSGDYPAQLQNLPDAPPFLWLRGNIDALNQKTIAIVGARNASSLGTRMARKLARDLGEAGYTIVSGLARGVDTAAHVGSLATGSIAVLAGGVDSIYPTENMDLGREILTKGALVSEQPIGQTAQARHFPVRNRLISGLAPAVVVIEAATKSGSLITARNALDQGREVLVVPGHPMDNRAGGCNLLIRDGATLVRSASDVIEAIAQVNPSPQQTLPDMALPVQEKPNKSLRDTSALHSQILTRLGPSPVTEDQLIRDLHLESRDIAPALTELELSGQINRQAGGLLALS